MHDVHYTAIALALGITFVALIPWLVVLVQSFRARKVPAPPAPMVVGDDDDTPLSNPPARPMFEDTPTGWGKIKRRGGGGPALVLVIGLSAAGLAVQGCTLSAISTIVAGVSAAEQIVAAIETVLLQKNVRDTEVDAALLSVHESLEAALAAARVASDLRDKNLQAAIDDAAVAYGRLADVIARYGIAPALTKMHTLRTAGGAYEVPTVATFRTELDGGPR